MEVHSRKEGSSYLDNMHVLSLRSQLPCFNESGKVSCQIDRAFPSLEAAFVDLGLDIIG